MKIKVKNVLVNYIQYGEGKDILLLHGWGQNIEMMKMLGDNFSNRFRITILDFPGFGFSEEPKESWNIKDYADMLSEFIDEVGIKKPIIMGHSFGGRVAIRYSAEHVVEKIVLFGSPCVRTDTELPLSVKILKGIKKLPGMDKIGEFAKNFIGSRDYKAASPIMRQTLVNVVNEDLSHCAKNIKSPTLLIWGDNDTEAPLEDAKKLEKLINDCGLIVFPGLTHYAYLENLNGVVRILKNFFE